MSNYLMKKIYNKFKIIYMSTPKITEFQKAQIGDNVIVKRYNNKTSKGTVKGKLPGALIVVIGERDVVINADCVVKVK